MCYITAIFAPNSFPAGAVVTTGDSILASFIFGSGFFLGPGPIGWGTRRVEHVLVRV